jgi:hypothetical protein
MKKGQFRAIRRRVDNAKYVRQCLNDPPLWYERDLEALLALVARLRKRRAVLTRTN